MPIEFPCPTCHQQVRTPDAAAGKKGKCPNCGTLVIIPAPVVALPAAKPSARPPDPARMPPPAKPQSPAPPASPAAVPRSSPAPAATGSIEFTCPTCHKVVRTPAATAGKKGQCPHCQAVVQIPTSSSAPAVKPTSAAKPMPVAKPLPTAKPIPKPQPEIIDLEEMPAEGAKATPGLTPVGSGLTPLGGGLTPLGPGPAPVAGLTPLGPAPASPAAADPFAGLTPLSNYPAVTPPATNPLGLPASSLGGSPNPYALPSVSPFGSGYGQPAYQSRTISDSHRRGLPWERDPSMDSFNETMSLVLGSPQEAFSNMRRTGGLGNPIGFMIIGMVIGALANAIYYGIIGNFLAAAASDLPFQIEALVVVGVIYLVGGVVGAVIIAPVATFIMAAIHHVLLAMVGGANAGYEATFRCLCFVSGSTAILFAIPCVGPLLYPFFATIIMIHSFANAHETSGGKAALSVLGPLFGITVCGCGCGIMFVFPAIMSAMNQLP